MFAALMYLAAAHGAPAKLPPVDQCTREPAFRAFATTLKRAVARRDKDAFLKLLAPDVVVNFGGDEGRDAFARQWFGSSAPTDLWAQMDRILKLGCARADDARVIPSLTWQFESDNDADIFELSVVTSPAAKLRKISAKESPAVATLAWDVVRPIESEGDTQTKVRLNDGREGWLWNNELRSPLDYRLVIKKRQSKWLITAFVAGD